DFLYPLLVTPRFDCRCSYEPGLARQWSWSDDGLTLTLQLRDDVRWSDGEAVDADDVRFTLELIRDPTVASGYGSYLEHLRPETPVETPDPHTVVVHFARHYDPDTMLSHVGGCPIVPQHALADVPRDELRAAPFGSSPVTAGPFRFDRWERGQRLLLERDTTAVTPPLLDRVEFRVIPEYSTRLIELERGEVDLLPGLQVADAERLSRERPEIRIIPRGHRYLDYIAWNLRDERFADERVRRALAHAVDADELIDALLRAGDRRFGTRAVGTITPELCDLRDEATTPVPHDTAAAAALFADAGWTDSDGDGWLDREGRRFAFTLETNGSNPRRVQAQVIVQEQLRRAGIDVTLATHEGNTFFDRLKSGEFEAALTGWGAALVVDPSRLWKSDGIYNFSGYSSAEADALIEQGLASTDPAESARRWRELQALIHA
ncbi:MAG: ABC transporter substrate-binding protein, partial [Myxococcota bacterium]|nr:ABC transporter substrate-binding protein [Myxococcota bacterium]